MIERVPLGNPNPSEATMDLVPGEEVEIGTSTIPLTKISSDSREQVSAPEAADPKSSRLSRRESVLTPTPEEIEESELIGKFRSFLSETDEYFPLSELECLTENGKSSHVIRGSTQYWYHAGDNDL